MDSEMNSYRDERRKARDDFNEHLAERMRIARKEAKLTQEALADSCGYSVQMMRRFESGGERNAAVPAFVLFEYSLLCGRTMEELCSDYVDDSDAFFKQRDKREADILKVLTEDEKELIYRLRRRGVELDISISPFLTEMDYQDYLILHCLLELKKQIPKISRSLTQFIRSLYENLVTEDTSYLRQFIVDDEEWNF